MRTTVNDATPQDAGAIVALFRGGFDEHIVGATVYGCDGVERFVAEQIRFRRFSPYRYEVCRVGARVVGAAEFRLLGDTLFLNYVAVDAAGQGNGVGRALVKTAVDRARAGGLARFALDVFVSNQRASGWYERIGMREERQHGLWIRTANRAAADRIDATVPDFAQAQAVHAAYGFSEFTVVRGARSDRVGRLGNSHYRLAGTAAAEDGPLACVLAEIDGARDVLATADAAPGADGDWRLVVASRRMSAPIQDLNL